MVHSTTDTDSKPYNFQVPLIPVDRLPHLAWASRGENAEVGGVSPRGAMSGNTFIPSWREFVSSQTLTCRQSFSCAGVRIAFLKVMPIQSIQVGHKIYSSVPLYADLCAISTPLA